MGVVFEEFGFIWKGTLVLDAVFLLISLPICGFLPTIFYGLLLSTSFMLVNFLLMGYFVSRAVEKSPGKAKGYMMGGYLIRMACTCLILWIGLAHQNVFHPIAVVLPLFYPKILYIIASICKKEVGNK